MEMVKKEFTTIPIGLGISHIEQEIALAHLWNKYVKEKTNPETFVSVSEELSSSLKEKNYQTGKSLLNVKAIEENNGKYRLTKNAIEKCNKFLNED